MWKAQGMGHGPLYTIELADVVHEPAERPFNSNGGWLYRDDGECTSLVDEEGPCRIDWRSNTMCIHDHGGPLFWSLLKHLKLIVSSAVVLRGGLLLHGSAVKQAGRGRLFVGPSGAGKSTVAQLLSPRFDVLSDELNAVLPGTSGCSVYATPFGPPENIDRGPQEPVPLHGIFAISKGMCNRLEPLTSRQKVSTVAGNACFLPLTRVLGDLLLENAASVVSRVPVSLLRFKKSDSLPDFIEHLEAPCLSSTR
jgi:hypothetical protein